MAISYAHQASQPRVGRIPDRLVLGHVAVAGALVCLASVAMAVASAEGDAAFGRGLLQLLIVGGPIAVGIYALRAPANKSFGIAMLGIGFAWSVTALAESSLSVPHTIGRLATWLTFPCVVYLLLAFPHGRIERRLDRAVLLGVVGVIALLFYGTAPFVEAFPTKTLWSTCLTDCPANALFVLDAQPAFLTQVILVREWLVELLWLGLLYSMYRRWRAASPLQRQAMGPAFIAGTLLGVSHYAHITARQLGAPADTVIALSSVWTFGIVAVCAAFLFGLVRRRMSLAGALARLGGALSASHDRAQLRDALAATIGDSTMGLLFRDDGADTWTDAQGRAVSRPQASTADRALTAIETDDDDQQIVLVHDVALLDDQELLDGVSGVVLAGWRHERLATDLSAAIHDLELSRRSIAEAADVERARIERDLHDGAQQRLVAIRIRLGLAEGLLVTDPAAGIREVHELGFEAENALEELRSLAHGIYPPTLTDGGLRDALRSVAAQAPTRIDVAAAGVTRQPIEIESAVYFACVEALQNALKHSGGAIAIGVTLSQTPTRLSFEVRDDGPGFTLEEHDGRGLRNIYDRIEAIGGDVTIDSQPGRGTTVAGGVPLMTAEGELLPAGA